LELSFVASQAFTVAKEQPIWKPGREILLVTEIKAKLGSHQIGSNAEFTMGAKKSKQKEAQSPPEDEHKERRCAKCFLVSLNSLMIVAGLVMIGLSIWLGTEYKGLDDMVSGVVIWAPLGLGFALICIAMLGCFGALYSNKCTLCIYVLFTTFFLVLAMVMSIFIFVEVGVMQDAAYTPKKSNFKNSDKIENEAVNEINSFQSALFNRCCFDERSAFGQMLYEVQNCHDLGACTDANSETGCLCYNGDTNYQYFYENFDSDGCNVMEDLHVSTKAGKVPLVGAVSEGGCGGESNGQAGDPKQFQFNVAKYAEQSLLPGAIGLLIVSILMLVGVFFGCFFFLLPERRKKEKYEKMPTEKDERQEPNNEKPPLEKTESDRLAERDDKLELT